MLKVKRWRKGIISRVLHSDDLEYIDFLIKRVDLAEGIFGEFFNVAESLRLLKDRAVGFSSERIGDEQSKQG
jgi:hypothetical protein